MSKIVDPASGGFKKWTDLYSAVKYLPVRGNLFTDLGLFTPEYGTTNSLIVPKTTEEDYILTDIPWGTRVQNTITSGKEYLALLIPHFEQEDAIKPLDLQGRVSMDAVEAGLAQGVIPETLQNVMSKKQATQRQTIYNTKAKAFMELIRTGNAYAPNGTIVTNYYTAFGVVREELTIDLFDSADPAVSIQAAVDNIQDNFKGGFTPTNIVGVLGRKMFDKLNRHPIIIDHVGRNGTGTQSVEILSANLGTQGMNLKKKYQVLEYAGVTFIRAQLTEMGEDEGRMFPIDVPDMLKVFYAPAVDTFADVDNGGHVAQPEYYRTRRSPNDDLIQMRAQTNFLTATLWPKAIIKVDAVYEDPNP